MSEYLSSTAVTIVDLVGSANVLFKIPPIQGEYVWTAKQVGQLLKDVHDSFSCDDSRYFIGGMVLAEEENEPRLSVIDGQQRLTTIMLVLSAARDIFRAKKDAGSKEAEELSDTYDRYILKKGVDIKTGMPKRTYLLELQGGDEGEFNRILSGPQKGDDSKQNQKPTPSSRNLRQAKETIDEYLKESFRNEEDLAEFIGYFLNKVHVVKSTAADDSTAFSIFETLNGTGSMLKPEDLLKNLLLQKVDTKDCAVFSEKWRHFLKHLTDEKGGYVVPVSSFLKHYIMSHGEYKNKDEIYGWFKKNFPKDSNAAKQRLADLDSSAAAYRKYIEGEDSNSVKAMKSLGFRQGFVVLLGSRNLPEDDRDKIAKALETVAFSYIITGAKTNALEQAFWRIAFLARQAEKEEDRAEKVQEVLNELKKLSDAMKETVQDALMRFEYKPRSNKNKTGYILSKLASALDGTEHSSSTIEHILPQSSDETLDNLRLVRLLGNLTLLQTAENSSLKNKTFQEKRKVYKHTTYRITHSLVEALQTETKDTTRDKAIAAFDYQPPADGEDWTEEQINKRTKSLTNLAMHVWFS